MSAKVFVSYSHTDEQLRSELGKHLKALEREGILELWHDRRIDAGDDWRKEIDRELRQADVVLLLISADFIASEFCYGIEMKEAMARAGRGETIVVPIILRPVDWRGAPFAHLQVLPVDGKPVTTFPNTDEAFDLITRALRQRLTGGVVPAPSETIVKPQVFTHRGMGVVRIPAGRFVMGTSEESFRRLQIDDPDAAVRESPQHVLELAAFSIGHMPVTNRQYREFLAGDPGHAVPFRDDPFSAPFNWSCEERTYPAGTDDHPVVLVNWYAARAFCKWMGGRLPTEAEWEKAARGGDARAWPWGNLWQPSRCNTKESKTNGPTPAGAFSPRGDSPFGVADMSGNVWEWCSSFFDPYPYDSTGGREGDGPGERVIRGGAWNLDRSKARCAYRGGTSPDDFGFTIGFRVAFDIGDA